MSSKVAFGHMDGFNRCRWQIDAQFPHGFFKQMPYSGHSRPAFPGQEDQRIGIIAINERPSGNNGYVRAGQLPASIFDQCDFKVHFALHPGT